MFKYLLTHEYGTATIDGSGTIKRRSNEMSQFGAALDALTKSEREVLSLVDRGLSNREIAATLSITVGTVKCHLHRAYDKLQVRNRLQAVTKAREHGDFSSQVWSYLDVTFDR
jgi:ATP/maltotriose-dependent transcriptional regulator MalT